MLIHLFTLHEGVRSAEEKSLARAKPRLNSWIGEVERAP